MIRVPPLQDVPIDGKTQRFSRAWSHWFQQWAYLAVNLASEVTGSLSRASLQTQTAGTLLGRGTSADGVPEVISLGTGLAMSGTTLSATGAASSYYEPLTTGIVASPELIYAGGDVVMAEVNL